MGGRRTGAVAIAAAPVAVVGILLGLPLFALPMSNASPPGGSVAGIPDRVLRAYRAVDGWCPGLRWQLVAGVGSVESGHGTSGGATSDPETGEVTPHIFGIPLDGSPGIQALPIGNWLGWYGLAGPWQQAVGPMQFLPGTFEAWAVDQDADGAANPHDIDDAVATAANYLCGGRDGQITDERAAALRYNHDEGYADQVLAYANQLGDGTALTITCPVAGPVTFSNTWLAPRSGGRQHKGIDMFANEGTPLVAPVAGEVDFAEDTLGGLAFHLWADDGNYYYGAHLSRYEGSSRRVSAGDVIGYVGHTGNAADSDPHLHFEIHPGRARGGGPNPVDPTPSVTAACLTR